MFDFNFDFNFNFDRKEKKVYTFEELCNNSGYPPPYPMQVKMKDFMLNGSGIRLLLGSRGYGKTDYGVIMGCAEKLIEDPTYTILLITKEKERGQDIIKEVKEVLKKAGTKFKSRSDVKLKLSGSQGKEPNLDCLSIKSTGLRGRHPKLIIMEDPITPDDDSENVRKRAEKVYFEACKLTHNIAIVGQPVNRLDLYSKLRGFVPTMLVKYGSIPELDPDLDAERAAGVDEYSIQASYFLELMDTMKYPFEKVKEVDYVANQTLCWIDPSHKGRDYTAVVCGGRNMGDMILTGFCFKKAWYDCASELLEINNIVNIGHTVVETNGLGELPVIEFRKEGMACVGFNTTINKHSKIMNCAAFEQNIKLSRLNRLPPTLRAANDKFIEQFKNYEYNATNDDAPDAGASLINYIRGL